MSRRVPVAAIGIMLLSAPAFAGYRPFTFTYDTYPMGKGDLEFEQWATYSTAKRDDSSFNRLDFREEIEYGLTDHFRLALYAPNWSWENSHERRDVRFDSGGVEAIWLLSNPVTDALGVGLYGEVNIGEHDLELEQKLLLQKDIGKWTFAYNFIVETELEDVFGNRDTSVEGVIGHALGISYSLSPAWRIGGELTAECVFEDWSHYDHTTVYAGIEMAQLNRRQFMAAATAGCACLVCPGSIMASIERPGPVEIGFLRDLAADGVMDKWVKSHGFFLIRAQGRLYASSSACTHKTAARLVSKDGHLVCPKHGSLFELSGSVTKGPARRSLPRYGISADASGRVTVDTSRRFDEGQWDRPGSYLPIG